jgi:hypothetical protein
VKTDKPSAFERLGASLVGLGSVLAGKTLIACRLRRAPEGWRRTLGILLRSEPTRFALSAFGVRVPAAPAPNQHSESTESQIAERLQAYLSSQPDAHFQLEWRDAITIRRRYISVDVVLLRMDDDGDLVGVEPHLAGTPATTLEQRLRRVVHQSIATAYNRTRMLPEIDRPRRLRNDVDAACSSSGDPEVAREMKRYAHRLLGACCLSFEAVDLSDSATRFRPPDFRTRRTLGFGVLAVVMRLAADRRIVDVWVSAHHVGLDGVPLQELVAGLEREWGVTESVAFPTADGGRLFMEPRACSCAGERDVDEMLVFVDFAPVFALRDALNARYSAAVGGSITFGALLAWLLNREAEFAGVRIASTVDVAASGGYDRDVDVVPLRPADFATPDDPWKGIVEFAKEFNRLMALSRTRTSPLRQGMQTAGLLPAWAHAQAVRTNPAALDDTFGSLCITIVRDAKVFVAPMTDLGLGHGFFAIGSAELPSADGRRVAAVSIKGDAGRIGGHAAILQRAIDRCEAFAKRGTEV